MEEVSPARKDEGLEQTILSENKKLDSISQMSQKIENSYGTRKTGPRDVFLHLLAIITLYFSAVNVGILLFQYINLALPDPLWDSFFRLDAARRLIRWAISALVVVFPVYVWVNYFLAKELIRLPEKKELRTRKWLLNFTLFVAALVIIGGLVSLIYNYLGGEISPRFILKILVVFLISAAVFAYYLWQLRREQLVKWDKIMKFFPRTIIALAALIIVSGFFMAGSPQAERLRRFDDRRVGDLQGIQSQIVFFWQQKNHLPQNLDELIDNISGYLPPVDPETNEPYEYRATNNLEFELCANFKTKGTAIEGQSMPQPVEGPKVYSDTFNNWQHETGRVCFQRKIDPELYKKNN